MWMETNIPEGFAVFSFPENQRGKLRSTNMVERLNREIKRRTRVATLFPNEASLLRLVAPFYQRLSKKEKREEGIFPRRIVNLPPQSKFSFELHKKHNEVEG